MKLFPKVRPAMEVENTLPKKIVKPTETLFTWEAPERPFQKKSRDFYRKVAVIAIFFSILLIIFWNVTLVIVIWIAYGLFYVSTTIEPKNVTHRITNNGVDYASVQLYVWEELESFHYERSLDKDLLILYTKSGFPGSLYLILSESVDKTALTNMLNTYISIEENPQKNFYESLMTRIGEKIKI